MAVDSKKVNFCRRMSSFHLVLCLFCYQNSLFFFFRLKQSRAIYFIHASGRFQLFSTSKDRVDTKEMIYRMTLTGDFGRRFYFDGVKYIHKDHLGETGLEDTTILFVKIFREKEPLGKATLYITAPNFAKQLATIEITNTHSKLEKLKWTAKFSTFFAKTIWNVYGPVSSCDTYFNLDAPPRKKRPLNLRGCIPEVYKCPTEDKVGYMQSNVAEDFNPSPVFCKCTI